MWLDEIVERPINKDVYIIHYDEKNNEDTVFAPPVKLNKDGTIADEGNNAV